MAVGAPGAEREAPARPGWGGGEGDERARHRVLVGGGYGDREADRERASCGGGLGGADAGGQLGGFAGEVREREADRRDAWRPGVAGAFRLARAAAAAA